MRDLPALRAVIVSLFPVLCIGFAACTEHLGIVNLFEQVDQAFV